MLLLNYLLDPLLRVKGHIRIALLSLAIMSAAPTSQSVSGQAAEDESTASNAILMHAGAEWETDDEMEYIPTTEDDDDDDNDEQGTFYMTLVLSDLCLR